MSGPDGIAGDRLRSFVERIERIDEDLRAMNDEKKDVFAGAKGEGSASLSVLFDLIACASVIIHVDANEIGLGSWAECAGIGRRA